MRFLSILAFVLLLIAACSPAAETSTEDLPPGNAANGEALFTQTVGGAPPCSTCHTVDGGALVGPTLQGYTETAATRIEGTSAEDYTHTSIVRPAAHLVSGFGNIMYNQYEQRLSAQQLSDLIAYLLTL